MRLGKSCSFGLRCMLSITVYTPLPFDYEDAVGDLFVLFPDQCPCLYFHRYMYRLELFTRLLPRLMYTGQKVKGSTFYPRFLEYIFYSTSFK